MVRKILFIFSPVILLTIIFIALLVFLNRNSGKGALQVTSLPKSKVYINASLVGETPLCLCQLSQMLKTGKYNIKLDSEKPGLAPFETQIEISPNVLTAVDRSFDLVGASQGSVISLRRINDSKLTELLVISSPSSASVFLDNSPVGTTPLSLKGLTVSDHDIKLSKDGYKDKIVKVKTVSGYSLEARVYLGINTKLLEEAPVASAQAKLKILSTPTGFLRVREDSNVDSFEIGQVKPGEEYEIIEEKVGWFKIKLSDSTAGWISASYVEKLN